MAERLTDEQKMLMAVLLKDPKQLDGFFDVDMNEAERRVQDLQACREVLWTMASVPLDMKGASKDMRDKARAAHILAAGLVNKFSEMGGMLTHYVGEPSKSVGEVDTANMGTIASTTVQ